MRSATYGFGFFDMPEVGKLRRSRGRKQADRQVLVKTIRHIEVYGSSRYMYQPEICTCKKHAWT